MPLYLPCCGECLHCLLSCFGSGQLLELPDFLPGALKVGAVVGKHLCRAAPARDKTVEGGEVVRGGEGGAQVKVHRFGGEANKDDHVALDKSRLAGVTQAKSQRARKVDACTPEGRGWSGSSFRQHAHHVREGSGIRLLAGEARPADMFQQVAKVWDDKG